MRFLIQIPQLIYGGAEKVLVSFANDLVSRGHKVEILESYEKGFLKSQFDVRVTFHAICSREYTERYYASLGDIKAENNIQKKIHKCIKLMFSKLVGYRRFAEFLASKYYKNKYYDVAINYLEIESPKFLNSSINAGKYIQWYHTDVANLDHPEDTDRFITEYERMDAIICVAESARESFALRYPQLKEKICVLYNFFDVEKIEKAAQGKFCFHAAQSNIPVFLSVGRMTPQKKYLRFLDVLKKLSDAGYLFQWYVLGDGIEREQIEKKIYDYHLQDRIFLEGLTDNPYQYMANCDLFVLPSGWEGFPTVTVEAKILKCAVLATDVSGIREQMTHGETGWIVENSEDGLYNGLRFLLDNPDVLEKIRSNKGMENIYNNEKKYSDFIKICKK